MKDNFSRLILCLAALELSENELRRLLSELRSMPWEEIYARISSLQMSRHHQVSIEETFRFPRNKSQSEFYDASIGDRVERLLKAQAGLSTSQAVEGLTMLLVKLGLLEDIDVPPLSRKSFQDWVARLAQRVPAKDILRCATILRNNYVHSPSRDWTLSKFEK